MTSSSSSRITIEVKGVPKALLSLSSSKKRELRIILRHADVYRGVGADSVSPRNNLPINEQRYSIHASPGIPDKNGMTHTLSVAGFPPVKSYHHTKAIKSGERFAHIYTRRAPDLSGKQYDCPQNPEKNVCIGSYSPKHFTLLYSVFVGPRGLNFDASFYDGNQFFNILQLDIDDFRVVIIWSFLSRPSHRHGFLRHSVTFSPTQEVPPEIRSLSVASEEGGYPAQCIAAACLDWRDMADEMIEDVVAELGIERDLFISFAPLDFFREGERGTVSWLFLQIRHVNDIYMRRYSAEKAI